MADTVAVMNAGRIEQMGHPADIYELPRTVFVANFLGQANLIAGRKTGTSGDDVLVEANGLTFAIPADRCFATGADTIVGVRPEKITFVESLPKTRSGKIMRRVLKARAQGLPEGDVSTLEE